MSVFVLACQDRILAPLSQALYLLRQIDIFAPLGLDEPDSTVVVLSPLGNFLADVRNQGGREPALLGIQRFAGRFRSSE